jgi:hypothetical protein
MKNILTIVTAISITAVLILPIGAVSNTKSSETSTIMLNKQPLKDINTLNSVLFEDGFESYNNFVLDFPPWTQYDGDGGETWGSLEYNFTNENYIGSFIIFNSSATEPPANGTEWDAHTGDKIAACFPSQPPNNPNDDWLISPELNISGTTIYVAIHCMSNDAFAFMVDDFLINTTEFGFEISFWAKSVTDKYGLERFQVGVSENDTNVSSFEIISEDPYIEAPITWTEYKFKYFLGEAELQIGQFVGGPLGVTAAITNVGTANATNVTYSMVLEGGFILLGENITENIGTLEPGNTSAMFNIPIIGLGKVNITASVKADNLEKITKRGKGFILLIWFFLND